jgi:hypothetical protein
MRLNNQTMFSFFKNKKGKSIFKEEIINSISDETTFIARQVRIKKSSKKSDPKIYNHFYQINPSKIKELLLSMEYPSLGEGLFRCGADYDFYLFNGTNYAIFSFACFSCNRIYLTENNIHYGYKINQESFLSLIEQFCHPMSIDGHRYIETIKKYIDRKNSSGIK